MDTLILHHPARDRADGCPRCGLPENWEPGPLSYPRLTIVLSAAFLIGGVLGLTGHALARVWM